MTHFEIVFTALSFAFLWVKVYYPMYYVVWPSLIKRKPFNCMMCLTGWLSFALALANNYSVTALLFLGVGVFVGAIVESLISKYL